jgi:hypothetical protein
MSDLEKLKKTFDDIGVDYEEGYVGVYKTISPEGTPASINFFFFNESFDHLDMDHY